MIHLQKNVTHALKIKPVILPVGKLRTPGTLEDGCDVTFMTLKLELVREFEAQIMIDLPAMRLKSS